MEQKLHANSVVFSVPVNRNRAHSNAFFTKNYFESQMPLNIKVDGLEEMHKFGIWRFRSV
jgi:hypothetical protein